MAEVDAFLHSRVTPLLQPGETIRGTALVRIPGRRHKITNIPEVYSEFLAVSTDRRLMTFMTEIGGFITPKVKPIANTMFEWWFDEIARVNVRPVPWPVTHSGGAGLEMVLVPHPGCGPFLGDDPDDSAYGTRNYTIFAAAEGLDGQNAFFHQFPNWLKGAVEANAFPMAPEKRATIDARSAAQRIKFEAMKRADAASSARTGKVVLKLAGAGVGALLVVFGIAFVLSGLRTVERDEKYAADTAEIDIVKADLAWAQTGKAPSGTCQQRYHYKYLPSGQAQCFGCAEYEGYPKPPPVPAGYRRFERGRGELHCPPVQVYKVELQALETAQKAQASAAKGGYVFSAAGAGLALVGLLVAIASFVFIGRKKAASS